ncbi:MAG: hypothetical protein ACM3QZ_10460 [Solirubrobacterales bacterium]
MSVLRRLLFDERGGVMEWALVAGVMGIMFYTAYQAWIKPNYDHYAQQWGQWLNPGD